MLNRRSFFQHFGGAILGTAIALKIPDVLIPSINIEEPKVVAYLPSYKQLSDLYNSCSFGYEEPTVIYVSHAVYEAIVEGFIFERHNVWYTDNGIDMNGGIKFRHAIIRPD